MSNQVITVESSFRSFSDEMEMRRCLKKITLDEVAVLVHIPQIPLELLDSETAKNRGYLAYPPQGLLYLSSVFSSLGVESHIVDLNFSTLREAQNDCLGIDEAWKRSLDKVLSKYKTPFIGISYMFDVTYPALKSVSEYIRSKFPQAGIVVGGVAASADPELLLRNHIADLVFSHEGEETIEQLYHYIQDTSSTLPSNLHFIGSKGKLISTLDSPGGRVDYDIRPEYRKIKIDQYHEVGSLSNFSRMNGIDIPFATILSRRGCRAYCSFCGVRNFNGKSVRIRDTNETVDEMKFLYDEYGIKHFDWLDDDLLFNRKDAVKMFREIGKILPDITWAANNGLIAAGIDSNMMDAMRDSGCIGFKIGLESGNEKVLREVHKPTTLSNFYKFSKLCKGYPEIFVAVNFILGFPEESFYQMMDSFKAALKAKLDWNNFYMYQPLKSTEMYTIFGGVSSDEDDYKDELFFQSHGKENQGPEPVKDDITYINPIRGGSFSEYLNDSSIYTGYDIIKISENSVPSKSQMKEIWFTFNCVSNFLKMPALYTDSEIQLDIGVSWIEELSKAYPKDFSMSSLLYYLKWKQSKISLVELEELRESSLEQLKSSEYWKMRDQQFGFSMFLERKIPELDPRFINL